MGIPTPFNPNSKYHPKNPAALQNQARARKMPMRQFEQVAAQQGDPQTKFKSQLALKLAEQQRKKSY